MGEEASGGSRPSAGAHAPVMVDEVLELLGGSHTVVDMTVGAGGHAEALLSAGVHRVVGIDRDPAALDLATERLAPFGDRFEPVLGSYSRTAPAAVEGLAVDGVLFDLGVSSMQLDDAERGFGYRSSGPLDMRMGGGGPSARDLVNDLPEDELARVIWEYGEERRSRRIARALVRSRARRPIETTDELARVVAGAVGRHKGGPHPARRTFQALRIAVNREIEELVTSLPWAASNLAPGGRVVVLSYHSLEDRVVKRFFLEESSLDPITRKPRRPSQAEQRRNPRSRSAKLRAAQRIDRNDDRTRAPQPSGPGRSTS
jgi:16S rRNA (cytosine1402-N4)-methyltransferase